MSDSNPNNEWVRLDVGGKVFKTTKSTLSTRPESFLARLVNSDLPSDKDETGAFLIDRDPEHFRTILNYLRSSVLIMDRNEKAMKELLCEADFYNIQPLVNEIRDAMKQDPEVVEEKKPVTKYTEMVIVSRNETDRTSLGGRMHSYFGTIQLSNSAEGYDVLKELRQNINLATSRKGMLEGLHYITGKWESNRVWMNIELTLRDLGFVQEPDENMYGDPSDEKDRKANNCWKFIRTVSE